MQHIRTTATMIAKIKSHAKEIKTDVGFSHAESLEIAAKEYGYENYHHATTCAAKTKEDIKASKSSNDDVPFEDQPPVNHVLKDQIKAKIMEVVNKFHDGVTFAELIHIEGFKGIWRMDMPLPNTNKVLLWADMSLEAIYAMEEMFKAREIIPHPTTAMTYHWSGAGMNLPVLSADQLTMSLRLTEYHWFPVVLNLPKAA